MKFATRMIEKPWGRTDLAESFSAERGKRIGEIWFEPPDGADRSLMVKFLFTSERLSIQVHPDDETAPSLGFERGKDECWLVLSAEEGASIATGLIAPQTSEQLEKAALDGSICELVEWRPVRAGDFLYNAAGTIHAIGAGLTLVEIQQNSDCTYRLYDYGRPRELHLAEGLTVARCSAGAPDTLPIPSDRAAGSVIRLVDGTKFHLIDAVGPLALGALPDTTLTIIPLGGGCSIDGEPLRLGEVAEAQLAAISLASNARALFAWPA